MYWARRIKCNTTLFVQFDGVQCIKSTDSGHTWRRAGNVLSNKVFAGNEVAMATLRNGSIMLNIRDAKESHHRWAAMSHDGGESFSEPWPTTVIGPVSNAAMLTLASGEVVLANPHNHDKRVNLSLSLFDQVSGEWRTVSQVAHKYREYGSII